MLKYACYIHINSIIIFYVLYLYQNGDTPLMKSVKNENVEMCKFLINNGALTSINTPDNVNICKNEFIS